MLIGLTGHTQGIGKAIFDRMVAMNHEVVGFSRACGHNISRNLDTIIDAAQHYDAFINNAHSGYAQVELLQSLFEEWHDEDRTIICIGSNAPESAGRLHRYGTEKAALDHACAQLAPLGRCRITNLRLGYTDTPRVKGIRADKLDPIYVAEVVEWLIMQPREVQVPTMTLLPRSLKTEDK